MEHIKYFFDAYQDDIGSLTYKIRHSEVKYDYIVGVVRGGCIPGVHLSNILDIPFVPLMWSHSKNNKDREHAILLNKDHRCLIVDDILDEGTTLYEIHQHYGEVDSAVLIYNRVNRFSLVPTYVAWTIDRKETPNWFDFWWEN